MESSLRLEQTKFSEEKYSNNMVHPPSRTGPGCSLFLYFLRTSWKNLDPTFHLLSTSPVCLPPPSQSCHGSGPKFSVVLGDNLTARTPRRWRRAVTVAALSSSSVLLCPCLPLVAHVALTQSVDEAAMREWEASIMLAVLTSKNNL